MPLTRPSPASIAFAALVALAAAFVVGFPVVTAALDPPLVSHTYPKSHLMFELLGFSGGAALLAVVGFHLGRRRPLRLETLAPAAALLLVSFHYLALVSEYSRKSWDYGCYEDAARSILAGENPYGDGYLYPPLAAQALAGGYRALETAVAAAPVAARQDSIALWYLVFFVYQCLQWMLVPLAFLLAYTLARRLGLGAVAAAALVAGLLLVNNPLLRTLRHMQLNLWILDLALAAMLLVRRVPLAAGVLVALGGHIKLYTLAMAAPWAAGFRLRAVIGAAAGALAVALIQTGGGRDWTLWRQFLASPESFPRYQVFRDNSLHGVVSNTFRLVAGPEAAHGPAALIVLALLTGATIAWFIARFARRDRECRAAAAAAAPAEAERLHEHRWSGHAADALAFALIASPLVWEHVYLLALPLVVWAVAGYGRERPVPIAIGAFLMFVVPTFDVYLASYHRLAGLLLVLHATSGMSGVPATIPARVEVPGPAAAPAPAGG